MNDAGRLLIVVGLAIAGLGVLVLVFGGRLPLGRLPGDLVIRREHATIWIPLGASLVLSLLLTLGLWLAAWLNGRR